jgi:poly(A) polymerase
MDSPIKPTSRQPCDREDALAVLKRLRQAGHVAYFAGGCVRDMLLGQTPKDWDIATDATPQRVQEIFMNTQAVGAAFGVVLVRHGRSAIEVATFRADGVYEDGRRPSAVEFTSAERDAQRRDFTINGLFFDPLEDRVIDFVDGRADLAARRLRAIGQPEHRFAEDHLRLLRAVRFAARFSLEIEAQTAKAIRETAERLKGISPERIADELRLMLTPKSRHIAWRMLWELNLAPVIFRLLPDIPLQAAAPSALFNLIAPEQEISFGLALAGAALCIHHTANPARLPKDLLKPKEISQWVRAMRQTLRISNDEADEMLETLAGIEPCLQSQEPSIAVKKRFLAQPTAANSRRLMQAMSAAGIQRERFEQFQTDLTELAKGDFAPSPLITGEDLIAAGFSPGPKFKRILDALYDAQLEGRLSTRQQALKLAGEI